jgi:inosose dehydratase
VLVLSADSGLTGYDTRPVLNEAGWAALLVNLDRIRAAAADRGVLAVLHPHVGTMVESGPEVQRVLEGSLIALCLDTGHLLIGGTDPADRVRSGRLSYTEAVRDGMYRPLGTGDVDVEAIVSALGKYGYDGWYVLEQDTILAGEPRGEGPVTDVRASADYVRSVLRA